MSNSSPLKRKREYEDETQLKCILQRFNKHSLITSIIKVPSEEHSEIANARKAFVIKEAIKILKTEFPDLETLTLYLHLRYLITNNSERYWTILEITKAKLYRSSDKVTASMLKYFTKYNLNCRVYSEMTSSLHWIVFMFSSAKPKPVFCAVHMKLSLIFLSFLAAEKSATTIKVIRKSFRGEEIKDLAYKRCNAEFIQNLNHNKWMAKSKPKNKAIENKDEELGISQKQFKNKRKKNSGKKDQIFEENEIEECFENNTVANGDLGMQEEIFEPEDQRLEENEIEECLENITIANGDLGIQNKRFEPEDRMLEENEIEEGLENTIVADGDLGIQDDRFEPGDEEWFENNIQMVDGFRMQSEQERYREKECPKNNELPIITELTYEVKSNEKEDNDFSYCIVKFRGTNILKGLNKLIEMKIMDHPLPDYLYKQPRTGKTKFRITK